LLDKLAMREKMMTAHLEGAAQIQGGR